MNRPSYEPHRNVEVNVFPFSSCHAQLGERAQAMRAYQRFVERLAKEFDAEPDDETRELFERIRTGNS